MFTTAKTSQLQGKVRAAVFIGGTFQMVARHLSDISGLPFHATFLADVADEIRQAGVQVNHRGVYVVSPDQYDQIGKLIDALKEERFPIARAVGNALSGQESDSGKGMGQVPAIAWMAFTRQKASLNQAADNFWKFLRTLAGGYVKEAELYVFYSIAGGTGRGAFDLVLSSLRQAYAQNAPNAALSIRDVVVDGGSYLGCGDKVEYNGATGAAQILSLVYGDTRRQAHENRMFNLVTLPIVGTDKARRDNLVRQTVAMLMAPGYRQQNERIGANMSTTTLRKTGKMWSHRFAYLGQISFNDIVAGVAAKYEPLLKQLLSNEHEVGNPTPMRRVYGLPSTSASPEQSVDQVIEAHGQSGGTIGALVSALIGQYQAQATVYAELLTGGELQGHEVIERELVTTTDVRRFLADERLLATLMTQAINKAAKAERVARAKTLRSQKLAQSHATFIYGGLLEKLMSWRSWGMFFDRKSTQVNKLRYSAAKAREAAETYAQAQAQHEALRTFRDQVIAKAQGVYQQIRQAISALGKLSYQGTAIDGFTIKPLDQRLTDILWSAALPELEELSFVLSSCVDALSVDTVARRMFGYAERAEADVNVLAALLERAEPDYIGSQWGQLDRTADDKRRDYTFLPLSDHEIEGVQKAASRFNAFLTIVRVSCGAGAFAGASSVYQVRDDNDVVTPHYKRLLTEMASDPSGALLALSCVPDADLRPEPTKLVKKQSKK